MEHVKHTYKHVHTEQRYSKMIASASAVLYVNTWEGPSQNRIQFTCMRNIDQIDDHIAQFDLTVVQNKFDGERFIIFNNDTLKKEGRAVTLEYPARIAKYIRRGFRIFTEITPDVFDLLLKSDYNKISTSV